MTTTEGDPVDRLYRAKTTPQLVQVPALTFLCLDGHGDPNTSPAYAAAVQALYSVSYAAWSPTSEMNLGTTRGSSVPTR